MYIINFRMTGGKKQERKQSKKRNIKMLLDSSKSVCMWKIISVNLG